MIGDFSLNTANPESVALWQDFGMRYLTVSYDLNAAQLADLLASGCGPALELTLHQHIPLFHTDHCVFCTFLSQGHSFKDCGQPCDHHKVRIMDRTHAMHYLRSDDACRNTMFNGQAQSAARYTGGMRRCGLNRFRIELLDETPEKATELMTREMVYTAMTRAENKLCCIGSVEVFARALAKVTVRMSNLSNKLKNCC